MNEETNHVLIYDTHLSFYFLGCSAVRRFGLESSLSHFMCKPLNFPGPIFSFTKRNWLLSIKKAFIYLKALYTCSVQDIVSGTVCQAEVNTLLLPSASVPHVHSILNVCECLFSLLLFKFSNMNVK